ncbi:hypothetical protein QA645_19435 [Bradyrhizobium sp. CIAT3101]|uniref:hypothetical protein n=1 Tax=Bradyrhizobium sp. CIAT3101 TaxID=439387 RepID=UPI0024B18430|nr:hypothetical protein [Bradyrhizobium sp. CIAT3101]WFU84829.1 hypothetical protein QA645_19435 [Bradyrhizobium sp. CIAT3101]
MDQPSIERARNILLRDLDPDFVEKIAVELGWQYDGLYEELANDSAQLDHSREEEFNRRRADCAKRAIARACQQHGIPFEERRLACNGQYKLLAKIGRVILIQEPILTLDDHPAVADYKIELSDVHGFVRQLELDLGDQPHRIRDWSGCVLAVLLHGAAGPRFSRQDKALGRAMLAIPDAAYSHWTTRLDLQTIAMFGRVLPNEADRDIEIAQEDHVRVTPKRRNDKAEFG